MQSIQEVITNKEIEIIKAETDLIKKADLLVTCIFKDQTDKAGTPYINHLYKVKDSVSDYYEKVVALLHDTVEDTPITLDNLSYLGFPNLIIDAVDLLTHKKVLKDKNKDYLNYVINILNSNNMCAINVKKADMEHNMDKERMKKLNKEVIKCLMNKYKKPYELIIKYIEEKERYNDRY